MKRKQIGVTKLLTPLFSIFLLFLYNMKTDKVTAKKVVMIINTDNKEFTPQFIIVPISNSITLNINLLVFN